VGLTKARLFQRACYCAALPGRLPAELTGVFPLEQIGLWMPGALAADWRLSNVGLRGRIQELDPDIPALFRCFHFHAGKELAGRSVLLASRGLPRLFPMPAPGARRPVGFSRMGETLFRDIQ